MKIKRMGVMNITPNSFSDGGEVLSPESFQRKLNQMGEIEALDIGAESTAPMNSAITWDVEWERWQMILPLISTFNCVVSADTYHPETIQELLKFWKDHKVKVPLFWNDVSGKFDDAVSDFLKEGDQFHYVLCHNRAPTRDLSGKHMDYVKVSGDLFQELKDFLHPHAHERVIFDPCLGFSKTYEENWKILDEFHELQKKISHDRWLLGFSRKSFLRKKFNLTMDQKDELDRVHTETISGMSFSGEVWIRTHRPELL